MLLEMWANRCGCLHGHSKFEQKIRRHVDLQAQVAKCYQHRATIPEEHQDIFNQPLEEFKTQRNSQYLHSWIQMFYHFQLKGRQQSFPTKDVCQSDIFDDISMYTWGTMDRDEYLVEETDFIEQEGTMEDQSKVPQYVVIEEGMNAELSKVEQLRQQWQQWGRSKSAVQRIKRNNQTHLGKTGKAKGALEQECTMEDHSKVPQSVGIEEGMTVELPRVEQLRQQWQQWGRDKSGAQRITGNKQTHLELKGEAKGAWTSGDDEIHKRKPPDGKKQF